LFFATFVPLRFHVSVFVRRICVLRLILFHPFVAFVAFYRASHTRSLWILYISPHVVYILVVSLRIFTGVWFAFILVISPLFLFTFRCRLVCGTRIFTRVDFTRSLFVLRLFAFTIHFIRV